MALIWLDGFDSYGNSTGSPPAPSAITGRKWATSGFASSGDIETGRTGFAFESGSSSFYMTTPNFTTNDTLIVGAAIKVIDTIDLQNGQIQRLFTFRENTTDSLVLYLNGNNLGVYRGTTLLELSNRFNIDSNKWYYIEMKGKCDNSAGTYEVKVNGTTILSGSGLDTQAGSLGYYNNLEIFDDNFWYDDMYVCDGSGSDNNDFLGITKVHTIRPDAAGDTNNFDSGAYTDIDEEQVDDDTTYAATVSSGTRLVANYDATLDFDTIAGVMVNSVASSNDAQNVAVVTISGSTTNVSSNLAINTGGNSTYTTLTYVSEQNPDTSSAWTSSTINSAQFGLEFK